MNRRYFRSSIRELETLFESRKNDESVLLAIQDELAYRKTERAAKLRGRVEMGLAQLGICPATPTLEQSSLQFGEPHDAKNDLTLDAASDMLIESRKMDQRSGTRHYDAPRTSKKSFTTSDASFNQCARIHFVRMDSARGIVTAGISPS